MDSRTNQIIFYKDDYVIITEEYTFIFGFNDTATIHM